MPPSSTSLTLSFSSISPAASISASDSNGGSELVPLLPALLVPLAVLLLAVLLGICLYRRYRSYQPSSISSSESPRWLRWLPAPVLALLYPSRRGYKPATVPSTPPPRTRDLPATTTSDNVRSPNEKSALLTGFTPQHHRNSSSLSNVRPAQEDMLPNAKAEGQRHEQSLMHRLGLGLGLGVFSSSPSEPRKPSGFTLEKGLSKGSYTALSPPPRPGRSRTGTLDGTSGRSGTGTATGTADQASSGNLRSIPDEQLFYRVPERTASSKDTSSGNSSYRARAPESGQPLDAAGKGWFSRFSYSGISGLPTDAAAPFWVRTSGESARGGGQGGGDGSARPEGDAMSVAVPDTPGTGSGDGSLGGSLGEFGRRMRWSDAERLSFPIPPPSALVSPAASPRLGGTSGMGDAGKMDSTGSE